MTTLLGILLLLVALATLPFAPLFACPDCELLHDLNQILSVSPNAPKQRYPFLSKGCTNCRGGRVTLYHQRQLLQVWN